MGPTGSNSITWVKLDEFSKLSLQPRMRKMCNSNMIKATLPAVRAAPAPTPRYDGLQPRSGRHLAVFHLRRPNRAVNSVKLEKHENSLHLAPKGFSMVYPLVYPRWPTNEKWLASANLLTPVIIGRCERIRTFDPLHPMQVRYQAAPHTD